MSNVHLIASHNRLRVNFETAKSDDGLVDLAEAEAILLAFVDAAPKATDASSQAGRVAYLDEGALQARDLFLEVSDVWTAGTARPTHQAADQRYDACTHSTRPEYERLPRPTPPVANDVVTPRWTRQAIRESYASLQSLEACVSAASGSGEIRTGTNMRRNAAAANGLATYIAELARLEGDRLPMGFRLARTARLVYSELAREF